MRLAASPIECVWPAGRTLGEGVWWSRREGAAYWVDIKNPAILRYRPGDGGRDVWPMPEPIGCCAPTADGAQIGAFRSGIYRITLGEPSTGAFERAFVAAPEGFSSGDRFNDGRCDPSGSFWAGSMDDAEQEARGYFHRLTPDGALRPVAGPYLVPNGPAFSPDGVFAYLTDSARQIVYRMRTGDGGAPKPFMRFGEGDGYPDGMCADRDGRLWIAFWDGGRVSCFSPDGERLLDVPVPARRPTCCAFGGDDLATLYVSSAATPGVGGDLGGSLFAARITGAVGLDCAAYAGGASAETPPA